MNIKVQCPCGTKFAFDVDPIEGKMPVFIACPGCNADATPLADEQIRKQLDEAAPLRTPPPEATPSPAPKPAISLPSTPLRPSTASPAPTASPQRIQIPLGPTSTESAAKTAPSARPTPVAPTPGGSRLSVRAHAPAPTPPVPPAPPATPTESATPSAPTPPQPTVAQVETPAIPKCSRHPRQDATDSCTVCGKPICPECMAQFGYLCSPYCQEQARRKEIEVPVYAGQKSVQWKKEVQTGNRVLTFLALAAGVAIGAFVLYKLVLSRPKIAFSITTPKSVPFVHGELIGPDRILTVTRQRASMRDWKLDKEIWSAELAPAKPKSTDTKAAQDSFLDQSLGSESQIRVRRVGGDVWIATPAKVFRFDLAQGTKRSEIELPPNVTELSANDFGILATVATNPVIQTITRIDFKTAAASSESIRLPIVRRRPIAQLDEISPDAPAPAPEVRNEIVPSGVGAISLVARLVESRVIQRDAVRKPKQSVLDKEGGPSAAQGLDAAAEFANENQAPVTEDQSVYNVSLRRLFSGGPEWTGSITGAPAIFPLPTLDVLVAGTTLVVFDKNNRKLWDARLNYGIGPRFTSGIYDPDIEATPGAQPVLQNNTRLYFFDQGTLTAFDTRDGRVAWRLPSVGITQVVPAGGSLYVASTTAGPESIQYSKDVTLNEKIAKVLHKVDAATGKIEWSQERIGEEPKVSGKFLYVSLKRTYLIDTIGDGDARPHYFFRRLDPSNGRQVWEYYQRGHAEASEVHENVILLRFLDELRVLKFMAL